MGIGEDRSDTLEPTPFRCTVSDIGDEVDSEWLRLLLEEEEIGGDTKLRRVRVTGESTALSKSASLRYRPSSAAATKVGVPA